MKNNPKGRETETKSSVVNGAKRGNRKERRSRSKEDKFYPKTEGSNDIAWHSPDAELLRRSATISWAYQTGELLDVNQPLKAINAFPASPIYVSQPGFMVIRTMMSCGGFGAGEYQIDTQPSYNAANSILTTMRSRTRVRNTYDAPDIMMLMLAMANIYGTVAFYKRIAATIQMFSYQNEYLPRTLLSAQGIDPEWFEKHSFEFVTQLNVIISEINKIYIPNRMHLFELFNQRFSNYYTEGSSIKDQIYMFTPAFISAIDYNETADYQSMIKPILCFPGTATYTNNVLSGTAYSNNGKYTGDVLLDALRLMVKRVIEHDSTADITGDMENAFGTSERFILSQANADSIALPIFDEEILETIHNCSVLYPIRANFQAFDNTTAGYSKPNFCIVQDVNTNRIGVWDDFVVQNTEAVIRICTGENSFKILDVHKDPSPEKTFAITRLRHVYKGATIDDTGIHCLIEFGADLVCAVDVYDYRMGESGRDWWRRGFDTMLPWTRNNLAATIADLAAFHYAPMFRPADADWVLYPSWVIGESDIYSQIPDFDTMRNMNRISLLSLLGAYNNA